MDTSVLEILLITAFTIGLIHTIIGPDHYLPFIVLGKANNWSKKKLLWITFICGLGHVLSSILLGLIGLILGIAVSKLEFIEATRGEIASWSFIIFGIIYCIWGLYHGYKNKGHQHEPHLRKIEEHDHHEEEDYHESHLHHHGDGKDENHDHELLPHDHPIQISEDHHHEAHIHEHPNEIENKIDQDSHEGTDNHDKKKQITIWTLFIIFVLGPCEPLIPLIMYPAVLFDWWGVLLVTLVFGLTTISTMLIIVTLVSRGLVKINTKILEQYIHAIAGAIITISGLAIILLGV